MKMSNKVELLAPAGNFEKLEIVIHYGADAVYLAGKNFSLRNFSGNFEPDQLRQAINLAHAANVKVYAACNVYSRNDEQTAIADYLRMLAEYKADAVIIADPGVLGLAQKHIPHMPVHLSTQANTTNYNSVLFWKEAGVKRIIAARELTLSEIKEIVTLGGLEIEAFVHGAMCISYSGRCLLSNFLTNRDSNRGSCAHPCRWKYAVVEEFRPGKYMPIAEDEHGSYIFNSKDLCMIAHIPELVESGIHSLKIEGRMKGINYLATTVNVYRQALDAYCARPESYRLKDEWVQQLESINHRGYSTGFYFDDPEQVAANHLKVKKHFRLRIVGKVLGGGNSETGVEVRNKVYEGDAVEVLRRSGSPVRDTILSIIDQNGQTVSFAQPGSRVTLVMNQIYAPNDIIRRIEESADEDDLSRTGSM
jgi:putative protease